MVGQVVADQAGNKVIAVVITRVAAQRQWVACGLAGGLQQLGAQLRGQKVIGQYLVD